MEFELSYPLYTTDVDFQFDLSLPSDLVTTDVDFQNRIQNCEETVGDATDNEDTDMTVDRGTRYDKFASELEESRSTLQNSTSDSTFAADICQTLCMLCGETYFNYCTVSCTFCKGVICDDCFYKCHYIQVVDDRFSTISVIEGGYLHPLARLYTVCGETCGKDLKTLIAS